MRLVDLSAPIRQDPAEVPDALRTDVTYSDHAAGAATIEQMLGVPRSLLRDGEGWALEELRLGTHNSTHVDAPWHYNSTIDGERAATIEELPLEWFYAPGVVVDARDREDGEALDVGDVQERLARPLEPLDIVLVWSGRDEFYGQPDYIARGPGVTAEATHWLYDQGIRVMGIDAWGWDRPLHLQAEDAKREQRPGIFWAAHQAGIAYSQIERLCNLGSLPATGATIACFPLPVVGGSAAPARVVGIVP